MFLRTPCSDVHITVFHLRLVLGVLPVNCLVYEKCAVNHTINTDLLDLNILRQRTELNTKSSNGLLNQIFIFFYSGKFVLPPCDLLCS